MDVAKCPQCSSPLSTRARLCHVCGFDRDAAKAVDAVVDAAIAAGARDKADTCANCGRTIGKLETPQIHDGHVVCHECKQRLDAQREVHFSQPVILSPSLSPQENRPTSDMWRNLRWLGFGMFIIGGIFHPLVAVAGMVLWLIAGVVWISTKKR